MNRRHARPEAVDLIVIARDARARAHARLLAGLLRRLRARLAGPLPGAAARGTRQPA